MTRLAPSLTTIAATLFSLNVAFAADAAEVKSPPPERFAKSIANFAEQDKDNPPADGVTVFVGSSSIRMWDLKKSFGDLNAINRGFGGSQISDVLHYADEVVLKYKPKKVVLFCGTNDIAHGKSPEQVFDDFKTFKKRLFDEVPQTTLFVLALKPAPVRERFLDKVRATNEMIREDAAKDERVVFLDGAFDLLMNEDGTIREELFRKDRLHMNDEGYKLWTRILTPHLKGERE